MTSSSPAVPTLDVKFRASCTAGCRATRTTPFYDNSWIEGEFHTGPVTFSSPPATGAALTFRTAYKTFVTTPGNTVVDPNASWDNPRTVRCDNAVGGTSVAGCAVPSETPEVQMSATGSEPGGAVAAYEWAQKNLNDAWGRGKSFTRSTSGVDGRTATTCGPFQALTELVDSDTCADFPFGEVQEGGIAGDRCVEVIPQREQWGMGHLRLRRQPGPRSHLAACTGPCHLRGQAVRRR